MHAEVVFNRFVTPQADKAIFHIRLNLSQALAYQPGDWLMVTPHNPSGLVTACLQALNLSDTTSVTLPRHEPMPLGEALHAHLELTQLQPAVLNKLQRHFGWSLWPDRQAMMAYAQGRDVLDLIDDLLAQQPELAEPDQARDFVTLLAPLAPRFYSIASAPEAVGETEVDLLYRQVVYERARRQRYGAASNVLSGSEPGDRLEVEWNLNPHFKLPEDQPDSEADASTPIVMIGAGTGLAPYLGFLQRRFGAHATSTAQQAWLFFGETHADQTDLLAATLPQSMLASWQQLGLKVSKAFSRDQAHKVYVQDRIWEARDTLMQWLDQGAYVYLCGDQSKMAPEVTQCFTSVLEQVGGQTPDQAAATWKHWRQIKRVQYDVY
ncbi:hypothetical protein AVO41_02705 [Thiomicrospira sp. WB1]|nr:hypothetical protein AVO41_02705 [Thiomicrospira sp. WB1]